MNDHVDRMQWVCQCGHTRALHNNMFSMVPPGQSILINRPDTECAVDGCNCVLFMPADFKHETFRADAILGLRRDAQTAAGIPVTFVVNGTELSVMKNSHDFKDFDELSEDILADLEVPEGAESVTYEWYQGSGFEQV